MICEDTTYRVVSWDTGEVLATFIDLAPAKKDCKKRGYRVGNRLEDPKMPIAYVECDYWIHDGWDENQKPIYKRGTGCIYNPRFK